ncbi:DNA mismatch repair endonuclease MutL [Flavobacteriaceae bacterium]|jgi:DNA mismatch repair protein MutL|nr:DNA mismatch repair endonuclease MutL [Flavobacteriaceae bacterium]MDA9318836.1 DNA mismatch repair endonuclease MutL [Flavobacteriaceae bacterium]MDB0069272.1 DNA mismatch repair endonuclease MutL [Flavobacteriaceae bacterium]MDB4093316.1 DNA mismatch repair endonuclease MutL [Flavobacteriaceae bacterium]MDB9994904.1 DNA mismatch repair endonuclease MutL [Flavobacteriaceae bacterium]|tara:strand:- start:152 stop:1927 length:1776 start_codon:yes stop_codon:yes gene_type:complete
MSIIKLLPDSVANQIAAGEVVQRPSSVVKELLENSIDSGAKTIKLIIKEAGKTLIQVIDDGVGMNEDDLKKCFFRHTTSKIRSSKDLFSLETMGFRGEALSSIASVSHMSIVSNQDSSDSLGFEIKLDGGEEKSLSEVVSSKGTSISVKNLFFNIPARRNFLKSDNVELKHIIDEFHRVALINHDVNFIFTNNNNEIFNLSKSIFKERIIRVFGKSSKQKLIPINEETEIAKISGFVFKPEFSRKTRSTQFFFVNNRFIRNSHLNHAVKTAYEGLIQDNLYPSYFLRINVPLNSIDVNIHPNKTEIKFDNDQSIYAILKSSIKHSLGQFNIAPTIDFDNNINLNTPYSYKNKVASIPKVDYNQAFNPFENLTNPVVVKTKDFDLKNLNDSNHQDQFNNELELLKTNNFPSFQIKSKYIITKTSSGIVIIDQKRAHQRILYENFLKELSNKVNPIQTLLFPITLDFNLEEIRMLKLIEAPLIHLGFKFNSFGDEGIEISGIHPFLDQSHILELFQEFLKNKDYGQDNATHTLNDLIAKLLSKYSSISSNETINIKLQESLVNDLFACKDPNVSPFGKLIFKLISLEEIIKIF